MKALPAQTESTIKGICGACDHIIHRQELYASEPFGIPKTFRVSECVKRHGWCNWEQKYITKEALK